MPTSSTTAHISRVEPLANDQRLEPLFASRPTVWLRVWLAMQGTSMLVAIVGLAMSGEWRGIPKGPSTAYIVVTLLVLATYHAVGYLGYDWIIRRRWATALFVPLGWVVVLASTRIHAALAVLLLGAILQGFIFLPFAWAIGTLAVVTTLVISGMVVQGLRVNSNFLIARVGATAGASVIIATVFLYIHRANRDAAIRARLLAQLEEAQRDLAERAREAGVQEERQRLARDIHDTLAQAFSSVIKHLEAIELSFAANGASGNESVHAALPHLAHAQAVSRDSLAEIRRLVWALRPKQLEGSTLPAAIERIARHWGDANGIAVQCAIESIPALQSDAEVVLLRALQVSLSNVARHAAASHVSVGLNVVDELVMLSVEDDGRGFDEARVSSDTSMGLAGMRDRVRRFNGRVLVDSSEGQGSSITVALPLETARVGA